MYIKFITCYLKTKTTTINTGPTNNKLTKNNMLGQGTKNTGLGLGTNNTGLDLSTNKTWFDKGTNNTGLG